MGLWDIDKIPYVGREKGRRRVLLSITTTPTRLLPARR